MTFMEVPLGFCRDISKGATGLTRRPRTWGCSRYPRITRRRFRKIWGAEVLGLLTFQLLVVGLITASHFIKGGGYKNILVIGADALSRFVDWTDRGTCILFGDAAGAILVQACSGDKDGLLDFDVNSDGSGQRHLNATAKDEEPKVISSTNGAPLFPPRKSSYSYIQMNGKEVPFRFAVWCVPQSIQASLEEAGLSSSSIDWLLLHQVGRSISTAGGNENKQGFQHTSSDWLND